MLAKEIKNFLADEHGATAVEYGLITLLIAVAVIASATVLGNNLRALFNNGAAEVFARQAAKL
ncbi:pilus assembly protein Flp/PilA [Devosia sp. YR412]|uniref:Flp family type IVb pilin n=1 Tax=Devosia sp. YR412 TaxID=1881030 RepID=UPI0008AE3534|nr:Flp family type IVb pilin [Devosia sp. YR412]SEQ30299.1 pilus assembly protein Flp/PilA [Devosia sp. YR412]